MAFGIVEQLVEQGRRYHDIEVGPLGQADVPRGSPSRASRAGNHGGPVAGTSRLGRLFGAMSGSFMLNFSVTRSHSVLIIYQS